MRGIAVVAFLAVSVGPVRAGIPDWAKAAAEAAPPVDEGSPEWPERTLLASTSIVVSPDGATWRIQRRRVTQVLSNRVADEAFGFFAFDDTTKIKKSKGWHVPPGERARRNLGGSIDLTLPTDFLTDSKARVVALEGVRKGSLMVYEFEAESHPYTLTTVESFYDDVPVSVARWSIELPVGWTLKYDWLPGPGPEPARSGSMWSFEQRDLVAPHDEPMGEPPSDLGPRLVVAVQPPAGSATPTPAFADWDSVGRWYQELAKGRETATPEIKSAANGILAKVGPAPIDRIRALSLFVRDRVRYLAREVGIGGYRPHPASQVLSELYGDCKDKGTLLRATLAASGFDAYPMLVHASNPYTVAPEVPVPGSFDHFVIGVVWPKDAPFPDEAASARVDAGDAGTLLVVDPTDERAWPGALPDHLAGKTALVVAGARGMLLTLPDARPEWHRIVRTATVAIAADRAVSVQLVSRRYGGPAEEARDELAASIKDRRESVEDEVRSSWAGAQIKDYKVTAEDADGAYVETVSFALPPGAAALQEKTFWIFSGATSEIERVALGKRKTAVQYPYPLALSYDVTVTGAAPTNGIPAPVKAAGTGWSVESTVRREGDAFHGAWTAQRSTVHFEPAAFPDLKQFWSAATKAAGPGLYLPD